MLCEARLVLFNVFAPNNLHPFLFLRYFLFYAFLYVLILGHPGFLLIFVKHTIRACMWQVDHFTAPDG